jgi:hypothetical protein
MTENDLGDMWRHLFRPSVQIQVGVHSITTKNILSKEKQLFLPSDEMYLIVGEVVGKNNDRQRSVLPVTSIFSTFSAKEDI